jgi:protein-S-isoprenylcysteine O-methyltransferase Ste14/uncharacterized membrane protein (UPF0127 family)
MSRSSQSNALTVDPAGCETERQPVQGRLLAVRESASGAVVADRLRRAHTHLTRLRGLLGTRTLGPGQGLWIKPCRQVHMYGMRYALDLVFLDDEHRVVHTVAGQPRNSVSERVADATSVLELPVGTLERTGLSRGSELCFDGDLRPREDPLVVVASLACNVALAALFAFFASAHLAHAERTGEWLTTVPIALQEGLLVGLFLFRRRSIATSHRLFDWIVGIAGAFLPLLLRTAEQSALFALGAALQIVGLVCAVIGLLTLGRCIAIVAANRGIKTTGLYAIVRHPMYGGYILSYAGYLGAYPTWRNLLIVTATFVAFHLRARVEERFLSADPDYRSYLERTPWRFVPFVY